VQKRGRETSWRHHQAPPPPPPPPTAIDDVGGTPLGVIDVEDLGPAAMRGR
jgi:hypothetical protein